MKKLLLLLPMIILLAACGSKSEVKLIEGYDTVEVGSTHVLENCIVTVKDEEYIMDIVTNDIDTTIVGNYLVTYSKTVGDDGYTCQRMVFVVDTTGPVVTNNDGVDSVKVDDVWVDAGVTVLDNYDTAPITVVTGTVDTTTAGSYTITYTATDASGNVTTSLRVVTVSE